MAFILEQAGGLALSGSIFIRFLQLTHFSRVSVAAPNKPVLDIEPKDIHERAPIFLGSKEDVEELMTYLQKYDS